MYPFKYALIGLKYFSKIVMLLLASVGIYGLNYI